MSRLTTRARGYINGRIDDHLNGDIVEAAPLHNAIADTDDGAPETLYHLATAAAAAYNAADCERSRDGTDPVWCGADRAHGHAMSALEDYIDELVAQECANVIQTVDEWEWPDDEQSVAAKREAREWLQQHTEAAERAGVFDDLRQMEAER